MIALQLASAAADGYFTNRNAGQPKFREHDPIARPFVTHGTTERTIYFAAYAGVAIGGATVLRYYHHDYLALALQTAQIEESTRGAYFSATHFKKDTPQ